MSVLRGINAAITSSDIVWSPKITTSVVVADRHISLSSDQSRRHQNATRPMHITYIVG